MCPWGKVKTLSRQIDVEKTDSKSILRLCPTYMEQRPSGLVPVTVKERRIFLDKQQSNESHTLEAV